MAHFVEIECIDVHGNKDVHYLNTANIVDITPRYDLGRVLLGSFIYTRSDSETWRLSTELLPKDVFFLCQ